MAPARAGGWTPPRPRHGTSASRRGRSPAGGTIWRPPTRPRRPGRPRPAASPSAPDSRGRDRHGRTVDRREQAELDARRIALRGRRDRAGRGVGQSSGRGTSPNCFAITTEIRWIPSAVRTSTRYWPASHGASTEASSTSGIANQQWRAGRAPGRRSGLRRSIRARCSVEPPEPHGPRLDTGRDRDAERRDVGATPWSRRPRRRRTDRSRSASRARDSGGAVGAPGIARDPCRTRRTAVTPHASCGERRSSTAVQSGPACGRSRRSGRASGSATVPRRRPRPGRRPVPASSGPIPMAWRWRATIATATTTAPITAGSTLRRRRSSLMGSNSTLTHLSWHGFRISAPGAPRQPLGSRSTWPPGPVRPRTISVMGSSVGQQYLLLADISGYTSFVVGVEEAHGVDFSDGIPPGYELLGALLDCGHVGRQARVQRSPSSKAMPSSRWRRPTPSTATATRSSTSSRPSIEPFTMRRTEAQPKEDHICAACCGRRQPRPQDGRPPRPGRPPDGRDAQRAARPCRERRAPSPEERHPGADRTAAVPVHLRCGGRTASASRTSASSTASRMRTSGRSRVAIVDLGGRADRSRIVSRRAG